MLCHGCGRSIKAGHPQGNNVVYCVDCHYKTSQVRLASMNHAAAMINYLGGSMDEIFGLPPRNRINVPQPNYRIDGTSNTINISNSIVGAVNTGVINTLNNTLENAAVNSPELVNQIKEIAQGIGSNSELGDKFKEASLEALTYLTDQSQRPVIQRNRSMVMAAVETVKTAIGSVADLITLTPLLADIANKVLGT